MSAPQRTGSPKDAGNTLAHVLLTGATSGIGYELGCLFSRTGYPLIIVGRDAQTLTAASEAFKSDGAPHVHTVVADLSLREGPGLVRQATDRLNVPIGILVNDAGQGVHGNFLETDLAAELDIIQLNICSLVHLTKLYVRDMVVRGSGRVLQLASIASYQPTPLLTVYAATKAFVLSFTEALTDELKGTGVTMTAVIPGPTDTDFFRKAGMEHTKAASDPLDARIIAGLAYEALMNGERHAVAPGMGKQILMSTLMANDRVAALAHKQMLPDEKGTVKA